jgi:multidrug efflux pump subunit AcrA (membrane-fusion protein)
MQFIIFLLLSLGVRVIHFVHAATESVKPKVIVESIKYTEDFQKLLYPARINAKLNSTVTADLDGHITKIVKALGSKVQTNDVILYIENTDPAFTYSAVPVKAQISGVLSQVNYQLMTKVNKGDKLFTIINPNSVNLQIEVPAAEIPFLKVGSIGYFQLTTHSENSLEVKVVALSPIVDAKSGTAAAELEFVKLKSKIKSNLGLLKFPVGTVGQVFFKSSLGKVFQIPESSIGYFEGKPTLYLVDAKNKSHRKFIELGEQRDSQFVVKKGLQEGDLVIIRSNKSVKEGEEVDVEIANKNASKANTNESTEEKL